MTPNLTNRLFVIEDFPADRVPGTRVVHVIERQSTTNLPAFEIAPDGTCSCQMTDCEHVGAATLAFPVEIPRERADAELTAFLAQVQQTVSGTHVQSLTRLRTDERVACGVGLVGGWQLLHVSRKRLTIVTVRMDVPLCVYVFADPAQFDKAWRLATEKTTTRACGGK